MDVHRSLETGVHFRTELQGEGRITGRRTERKEHRTHVHHRRAKTVTYHHHAARLIAQGIRQRACVVESTRHAGGSSDTRARAPVRDDGLDSLHEAPAAGVKVLQLVSVEAVDIVSGATQPPGEPTTTRAHIHGQTPSLATKHDGLGKSQATSGIHEEPLAPPGSNRGTCRSACSR